MIHIMEYGLIKFHISFLLLILLSLLSCDYNSLKENNCNANLKKLNDNELLILAREMNYTFSDSIVYTNENCEILSLEQKDILIKNGYFPDYYISSKSVVELIKYVPNRKSKYFLLTLDSLEKSQSAYSRNLVIDCDLKSKILQKALKEDQNNRKGLYNYLVDKNNISTVLSVIETCGILNTTNYSKEEINSIFFIIQHSSPEIRSEFYPFFERLCNQGIISKQRFALLVDRHFIDQDKAQYYGTQLKYDTKTKQYKLLQVSDIENLDSIRSSVGLEPIDIYIDSFNR